MSTLSAQLPANGPHTTKRLHYIDSLRGIAILGVVVMHAGHVCRDAGMPDIVMATTQYGARGVELFFLLSALTLLSVYRQRDFAAKPFFIRRFFRVAPMFYLAALFYCLLDGMGPRIYAPQGIGWHQIALTLTFLHGWTFDSINSVVPGGWSIADEAMFYLLFPLLLAHVNTGRKIRIALLASIVIAKAAQVAMIHVFATGTEPDLLGGFLVMFFLAQLPAFLCGFAVFYLLQWMERHPKHVLAKSSAQMIMFALSVLLMTICAALHNCFPILENYWLGDVLMIPFVTSIALLNPAVIVNEVLQYIGKVSFSIYLVHFVFFMHFAKPLVVPFLQAHHVTGVAQLAIVFAVILLPSLLTAAITYPLIELPMIALGHRIARKLA